VRHETVPGEDGIMALGLTDQRDPLADMERRDLHRRLLLALGALSESQRQGFVRVDLEGEDQQAVARALGVKHATVRATLHFARKRLAGLLREVEE